MKNKRKSIHLNIKQIEDAKILIPPIDLQNNFAKFFNSILSQMDLIRKQDSYQLFNALLQKAFKGEIVTEKCLHQDLQD